MNRVMKAPLPALINLLSFLSVHGAISEGVLAGDCSLGGQRLRPHAGSSLGTLAVLTSTDHGEFSVHLTYLNSSYKYGNECRKKCAAMIEI